MCAQVPRFATSFYLMGELSCRRERQLAVWGWQFLIMKSWRAFQSSLGSTEARRRCVWSVVGIGVGLLRYDGEVEGVVVKDDAVLELCVCGRARYAQVSQNEVTMVFQVYFSAGCCNTVLRSAACLRKATIEGPIV